MLSHADSWVSVVVSLLSYLDGRRGSDEAINLGVPGCKKQTERLTNIQRGRQTQKQTNTEAEKNSTTQTEKEKSYQTFSIADM